MAANIVATGGTGPGISAPRNQMVMGTGKTYYEYHFKVTFDSSYPAGGESIAADVDADSPWSVMRTVSYIVCIPMLAPTGTGGYSTGDLLIGVADIANKKLLLYLAAAAGGFIQATDTTASQLITIPCIAYGYR